MTRNEIVQALYAKNITIGELADVIQVTRSAVSNTIAKGRGSRRVAETIAQTIGEPLERVFPYYTGRQAPPRRVGAQRRERIAALSARLAAEA